MKEYKYRVWNGEQMISPDYIDREGYAHWKENSIPEMSNNIMQFTGIKDCEGKEIYEGDIIKTIWNDLVQISVIEFMRAGFTAKYFSSSHPDFKHYTPGEGMDPMWWDKFSKVIGNIYENSELIEESMK